MTVLTAMCALGLAAGPAEIRTDYFDSYREAEEQEKMLLVDVGTQFDFENVERRRLEGYVLCRVPADYEIEADESSKRLLSYSAFSPLDGRPGLVVIDLKNKRTHGHTVSALPQRHVTPAKVSAMLNLPAGTLTQRTLVWAFRIHQQRPLGTYGTPCPQLMAHAERHSGVQCQVNNQHHDLSHPGRTEIVAESWPWNKNVVDAAIDIVWSWSQSSGHWSAACQAWSRYGCDMKSNGHKWFATGVFQ